MTKFQTATDLHTIVTLQDEINKILDRLAKNDDPRLAVITALGEVDTGLRARAVRLGNDFHDEADAEERAAQFQDAAERSR